MIRTHIFSRPWSAGAVKRGLLGVLVLLGVGVGPLASTAQAHQPGQTVVEVSYEGTSPTSPLVLSADVTLDRYDLAYGTDYSSKTGASRDDAIAASKAQIAERFRRSVRVSEDTGAQWAITVGDVRVGAVDGYVTLHVDLTAQPPASGTTGHVSLAWEVVTDTIYSHKVFVGGKRADGTVQLVGTIQHHQPSVVLELGSRTGASHSTSPSVSFASMVRTGFGHFREGADHLLFLCLLAIGTLGSVGAIGWRAKLRRLLALTVAFTVGHSLSLAAATSGWVRVPGRLVEIGIAVTIVATASHTMLRLVSARTELLLTAVFGLIHGFGFAGVLTGLSLRGTQLALPVFGFNLGLEAAQFLALLALAVPVGLLVRSRLATNLAVLAVAITAANWVLERALSVRTPISPVVDRVLSSPERVALVVLVLAAPAAISRRITRRGATPALA